MREAIKFTFIALFIVGVIICIIIWPKYGFSALALLLFGIGIYDLVQKKHTILRNFPVIGHMRYLLEMLGPEIHQYFVENDTDGTPIDRNHRGYIYERAKHQNETHPFGTELNVEEENYKWMQHSIYPAEKLDTPPRVQIGGPDCKHPYSASLFNISAMSFGALSSNAVEALNLGARAGNFFHDTGEGGISPYHRKGGDLVYEVGTGYFGCRTDDGRFDPGLFKEKAAYPEVKMIELKISQGAKPGHGGVLPAAKNNEEIAKIRGVKPHTKILSPPGHKEFSDAEGLLKFIKKMRDLSDGKPIGFKLCIGSRKEFTDICEKMVETGIKPDFITVDGSEGGTGAAPIDFSNYVGMPWEKALVFVVDTLNAYDLKKDIKVLTATKIFTAFDVFKAFCIGADVCNSARGMMLALGCIQALRCDTNKCPTGITSNKASLRRGLVVADKWKRVRNYHQEILNDFLELFAAAGCSSLQELDRNLIYKRVGKELKTYEELYPTMPAGSALKQHIS
ncbi:FMN-binding glutamate synthase family protein [Christiangramia fulva]|uniref:FMN-binding glutamate synthase family protein n=1 Tax=Christiangramia fulva TaxID=2126553 RepID=A0A2R3Z172_9FLAO|nr:FMN-binding glutamate synthase family protein [Christiangramia fulva]AVR43998.1 FMN-binding glutamate synthase family protein [Christiangramia fulva]